MNEIEINQNISSKIDFSKYIDKERELIGMGQNIRFLGWGAFIILRLPNYNIQTVVDKNNINIGL